MCLRFFSFFAYALIKRMFQFILQTELDSLTELDSSTEFDSWDYVVLLEPQSELDSRAKLEQKKREKYKQEVPDNLRNIEGRYCARDTNQKMRTTFATLILILALIYNLLLCVFTLLCEMKQGYLCLYGIIFPQE